MHFQSFIDCAELKTHYALAESDIQTIGWGKVALMDGGESAVFNCFLESIFLSILLYLNMSIGIRMEFLKGT